MHRHGYKGRKFGRERDQRSALIKGLADSLILHESIETTLEKAKDLRPYVEKIVTKARKGGLHNRRVQYKTHIGRLSSGRVVTIGPAIIGEPVPATARS